MSGPLEGIKVVECAIWIQGPTASAILGDLGAEIIKVEQRLVGDPARGLSRLMGRDTDISGRNFYFETLNRGKKSITLDLNKLQGKKILYDLVRNADVFLTNFRQKALDKLGIDQASLEAVNPNLVYVNSSGFGPRGPESNEPSFDLAVQAKAGLLYDIAGPGLPPVYSRTFGLADQAGAVMAVVGTLAALFCREKKGFGQKVDSSILGGMVFMQSLVINYTSLMEVEYPGQVRNQAANPLSNYYQCRDAKWIVVVCPDADRYWPNFCEVVGIQDLENDPRYRDINIREENSRELIALLDKIFATRIAEEWISSLRSKGVVCALISAYQDVIRDPQVLANDYVARLNHPVWGDRKLVVTPLAFNKTPTEIKSEAPEFGQHTEEILRDIGYSWEEVSRLKEEGVI